MVAQTFDLSELSRRSYADTRGVRVMFIVVAVGLAAAGVIGLVYHLVTGTLEASFRVLYGVPYYVAFGAAFFLGWGSTRFAPGATRMTIGDDGVAFSFPGRGELVLHWLDPRFRLNVEDARVNAVAQKYGFDGDARVPNHPSTTLPGDALDTLIAAVKEHHMAVAVRKRGGRWSPAGPVRTWVEIRASLKLP